jgi:glucose-6-phosphate 1-dehydrogenase
MNAITPVEFDWIYGNGHDYGFTAQDIQEHFNKNLVYNVDGYLGFDQVKLIPYITKSIQEISETLEIIKQRL